MRHRCRNIVRWLALMLALTVLFLATAGPGGGGFGGGGGSFGRGFGSGGRLGTPMPAWFLAGIGLFVAAGVYLAYRNGRYKLVHLTLLLENGAVYAPALDKVLTTWDFDQPQGRQEALKQIARRIDPEDIREGSLEVQPSNKAEKLADEVQALWKAKMEQAGLEPIQNGTVPQTPGDAPRVRPEDACVLGIVASVNGLCRVKEEEKPDYSRTLHRLAGAATEALYLYYAPDPGKPLPREQAQQLFKKLRPAA